MAAVVVLANAIDNGGLWRRRLTELLRACGIQDFEDNLPALW